MSTSYNPAIPNPPDAPSADVAIMQSNAGAISTVIARDHVGFNVLLSGRHKQVTFAQNNVPTVPTSPPVLFTQNDAFSTPQLFYYTQTNNTQYSAAAEGSCFLFGGIILKWGHFLTSPATVPFPVAFPHNCFNVVLTTSNSNAQVHVNSISPASFTMSSASSVNFYWIAIGN